MSPSARLELQQQNLLLNYHICWWCFSEAVAATSRERCQEETPTPFNDYLDKEVTDKERIKAAIRIQSRWQRIGRILGPKPFKDYEIDAFEQKKEYRDQAQAMLDAWANAHYN